MGAPVWISHHPTDPAIATVKPGVYPDVFWLPGGGLAFLLFGLAALIWGVPALSSGF